MDRSLRVARCVVLTAVSLGFSAAAHAQDAAPAAESVAPPPPPISAESAGDGVKEIIVTARRRNETIQQTPVAITAIAPQLMESTGSVTIVDLQGRAPNVLISPQIAGAGGASVSIRGLGFNDIEKSFDTPVAIVNDGVFIGTNTGQMLDFFDIASIEILRGPQGTLFGRNTIGGVINITRTRPTGIWGGKFQVDYGKFDTWAGRAVVNAPIIPDVLAAKGFYYRSHTDGFYRNFQTGKRAGRSNSESFGASLLFTPSSAFKALLTVEKLNQDYDPTNSNQTKDGEGFAGLMPPSELNRNKTTDLYTVFIQPTEGEYHAPAVTLQMDGDLGPVKLTSITAYRSSREFQTQDFDASSADLYYTFRRQRYHQFSQELRAAGKIIDSIDYVAGLYYFNSHYNNVQHTRVLGIFGGLPETLSDVTGNSKSMAAFVDVNWQFADKFRLDFGGRFTHDRKDNMIFVGTDVGSDGFTDGTRIGTQFPKASKSWKKFTPKISLDYRPDSDHMIYATWSQGYRSGGFNGRGSSLFSATTPYGIETVNSYELGAKTASFDRKLLFNIAGFYTAYKGMQQPSTIPTNIGTGNETVVFNVGSSKIYGVEVDVTARPVRELTINGSLGYLKTTFKDFLTGEVIGGVLRTVDYSAVDQIFSPKITASVSADYEVPVGPNSLKFAVNYRYLAPYDQFITRDVAIPVPATGNIIIPRNDPRVRTKNQNLLDASITYLLNVNNSKVRMTVYGRNLLDQRGANMSFPVAGLWTFAAAQEPRTYGVQLGFQF